MKRTAVLVLIIHYITISHSRLIKKVTEATPSTGSPTSSTPVRLRRFLAYDDSVPSEQSNESALHEKTTDYLSKNLTQLSNKRTARNSNSTTVDATKFQPGNDNKVLVKKPIPKFAELDDYESEPKAYKIIPRLVDSDELEDEDFNVDDYDFDVKHDEFVSRGKPIVPRFKEKDHQTEPKPETNAAVATDAPAKIRQSVQITSKRPMTSRQRSAHKAEKSKDKRDEFYDYEITTKITEKEKAEETSDETEESKEFGRNTSRRERSPWNEIMLPAKAKSLSIVPKHSALLPMFPIVPKKSNP